MKTIRTLALAAITGLVAATTFAVTPLTGPATLSINNETYVLQNNIVVAGQCFLITGNNITLDGNGFTITGNGTSYGVRDETSDRTTITNLTVDGFNVGIRLFGSTGSSGHVLDCTSINNAQDGVYLRGAVYTAINSTFANNGRYGIYQDNGNGGTLAGNTVHDNTSHGIRNRGANMTVENNDIRRNLIGIFNHLGSGNIVRNNTIIDNGTFGIALNTSHNGLYEGNEITGSSYGIDFNTFVRNNLVIDNNISGNVHGIDYFIGVPATPLVGNNSFIGNTVDANADRGLYNRGARANTYEDNSFSFNGGNGAFIEFVSEVVFSGNTVDGNGLGVRIKDHSLGEFNDNVIQNNGTYGIRMGFNADNNTVAGNTIVNNSTIGLQLVTGSGRSPSGNTIYNNFFNNSRNVVASGTPAANSWNVAATAGPNIIGGPSIGGNYWANPTGTGHSETCTDANLDGFCDTSLTLAINGNVDSLPLTISCFPCDDIQAAVLIAACAGDATSATSFGELVAIINALIDDAFAANPPCEGEAACRAQILAQL